MEYGPFIKSQLASESLTHLTLGPYLVQIWSRNNPESYIYIYPLSAETFELFARFNENYYTNV